jgi:SAM-dependent methyltransferase
MSYRLALGGHFPVAVDVGVSRKDGLGAAEHYTSTLGHLFPRFQAEMDQLPFADGQFDLAIYNASLHYARDYEATVREAVRVLRLSGAIAIVDSPTYGREADGEAMMNEKSAEFSRKFGTDLGGMGGQGYLTPESLHALSKSAFAGGATRRGTDGVGPCARSAQGLLAAAGRLSSISILAPSVQARRRRNDYSLLPQARQAKESTLPSFRACAGRRA